GLPQAASRLVVSTAVRVVSLAQRMVFSFLFQIWAGEWPADGHSFYRLQLACLGKTPLDFARTAVAFVLYLLLLPHSASGRHGRGAASRRVHSGRTKNERVGADPQEKGDLCRCVACRSGAGSRCCAPRFPWWFWQHVTTNLLSLTWPA